jgi:RNA polymerase sigma factor (sigma-70 family)
LGRDFVSEVAIRTHEYAFSHLNNYSSDRGASFQTWLNWLSRSFAGHVKREWYSQRFARYDQALHEAWAVSDTGPADVYEETRLSRVLQEETESLPEGERQVIVLHDIEGRSHPACARATGLTYEQVRHKRRLALAVLRRRLQLRGVRPVPIDSTPAPIWYGEDSTDRDDDFTASETAVLPDGPDTLTGEDAKIAEEVSG